MDNMKIVRFLLFRSDLDRQKLQETTREIIKDGIGSRHLDRITEKSFLDRGDDYYTRIFYYVESNPENIDHLFTALIEWYDFWKDDFSDFNETAEEKYKTARLKTWTYCILNGMPDVYYRLSREVSVNLSPDEWEDLQKIRRIRQKVLDAQNIVDKTSSDELVAKKLDKEFYAQIQREIRAKRDSDATEKLRGRRIIIYSNTRWDEQTIEKFLGKYQIKYIHQASSLEIPKSRKEFDFILFSTVQAKHSVLYKLKQMYEPDRIFLIEPQNPDSIMNTFIDQLVGYNYNEGNDVI